MKNVVLALSIIGIVSLNACKKEKWPYCIKANGKLTEETRVLANFDEVEFDLPGNLYIIQDSSKNQPEIRIETSDNIIDRIETEVKGDRLIISDKSCIRKLNDFDAYLYVQHLEGITLNGSGDVFTQNRLKTNTLTIALNGSGDLDVEAATEGTVVSINGSGSLDLEGLTDDLDISINGSGDVRGFSFPANSAIVDITGSGNVEVNVASSLDVDITGSGNVTYKGNPSINFNGTGSGSVKSH